MQRFYYMVTVDTNDERPHAQRRQGLEIARAIHNGSIRNVQVFRATEMGSIGPNLRYDPKEPIDRQLED